MADAANPSPRTYGVAGRILLCAISVLGILAMFDIVVVPRIATARLASDVVDIQTPPALIEKARHLAAFGGKKIVLLGDSLVAGQIMGNHGDADWRQHTISADIQNRMDQAGAGRATVMNLGMNGILPADLETLAGALLPLRPDVLIIDVSLRSFSQDFATPDAVHSRAWLKPGFALDQSGQVLRLPGRKGVDGWMERFMLNHWAAYRSRDLVRAQWFGGEPKDAVAYIRAQIETKDKPAAAGGPAAEMRLLLQVRGRYAKVGLEPGNPQFDAWVRLMHALRDAKQKAVVFYGTETPRLLPSLMDSAQYKALTANLREATVKDGGGYVSYLDGNSALTDDMFLDHVHVDAAGNKIYGESLFKAMGGL